MIKYVQRVIIVVCIAKKHLKIGDFEIVLEEDGTVIPHDVLSEILSEGQSI